MDVAGGEMLINRESILRDVFGSPTFMFFRFFKTFLRVFTSLYIFQRGFPQSLCFSCKGFSPVFMLCKVFFTPVIMFFFMFFFTSLYVVVEPSLVLSVPLGDPIA